MLTQKIKLNMPIVNSNRGEDLASTDEVRVYHDEGEQEEPQKAEEDISEVKLGLVTETERNQGGSYSRKDKDDDSGPARVPPEHDINPFYYPPFSQNGATTGKIPGLGSAFNNLQPPPAHTGSIENLPLLSLEKSDNRPGSLSPALAWLHRPSLFPLPGGPGQYSSFYSDLAASWQGGYPSSSGIGIRSPYSEFIAAARGYPGFMQQSLSPGMSQPSLVSQANKQESSPHIHHENKYMSHPYGPPSGHHHMDESKDKKKNHIKKPLNAFMLFMKDMRAQVVSECTLKESAAINQILGRKWHALDRTEQAKYYDMAKKERELHLKLYPGWSARDNYAMHSKRKKRRRDSEQENKECTAAKKCRARFGLDQQTQWCKPCRSNSPINLSSNGSNLTTNMPSSTCNPLELSINTKTECESDSTGTNSNSAYTNQSPNPRGHVLSDGQLDLSLPGRKSQTSDYHITQLSAPEGRRSVSGS